MSNGPVKSLYEKMARAREPFLKRARRCSQVTIPSLVPPQNIDPQHDLATPFQSVGARGVNNLASKLLLALFPPNSPFFRLRVGEDAIRKLEASGENVRTQVEESLATFERQVQAELEASHIRVPVFEALKHAIVAGNGLCFISDEGMRVFHLSSYVVKRDPMGKVLCIITREEMDRASLPPEMLAAVVTAQTQNGEQNTYEPGEAPIEVFTQIKRVKANRFEILQEVCGLIVPGSEGAYTAEKLPYIPLRFNHISGEDYGRGHVEEYEGDLWSLEGLAQALVEGAAAAARVLFLVNPNSATRKKALATAKNGAFIDGMAEDVTALQLEKYNDFRVAKDMAEGIEARLSFAFLLNTAIQRNGERVTAEEIRFMAGELEDALGGVYSILSQELQLPLVRIVLDQLVRQKKMPKLPKEVRPSIITGLEALGRGHDLTRLQVALKTAQDVLGPEAVVAQLNTSEAMSRIFTASGVEPKGLLKTAEELAAEAQQAQTQQLVSELGPEALKQAGTYMNNQAAAQPAQAQ